MSELRPFRFWCQKVLPLVYDDSLSYYELLCKVVDYLNNTISDVNKISSEFQTLYNYVHDYFKNLDVQDEINNKLDEMSKDGTLNIILQSIVYSPINVINAGIKNNGSDITSELQTLINAHTNGKFYFPDGTYYVDGTITLNSNIEFILESNAILKSGNKNSFSFTGDDVSFKMSGGIIQMGSYEDFNSKVLTGSPFKSGMFYFNNCNRIEISSVTLQYNSCCNTFMFVDCNYINIHNCYFNNFLYGGIMFYNHCTNMLVNNCHFINGICSTSQPYNYPVGSGFINYNVKTKMPENYFVTNCTFENCEWEGCDCHGGKNIIFRNLKMHNCNRFITIYADNRPLLDDYNFSDAVIENCYLFNEPEYTPPNGDSSIYCNGRADKHFTNLSFKNIVIINPVCYDNELNNRYGVIYTNFNENVKLENVKIIGGRKYSIAPYILYLICTSNITIDGLNVVNMPAQTIDGIIHLQYVTGYANNVFVRNTGKGYSIFYAGAPSLFRIGANVSGNIDRNYYTEKKYYLLSEGEVIIGNFPSLAPSNMWGSFTGTNHKGFGLGISSTDTSYSKTVNVTSGNNEIRLTESAFFSIIGTSVTIKVADNTLDTIITGVRENYITVADVPNFSGNGTIEINRLLRTKISDPA